jgi:hypothetical protein
VTAASAPLRRRLARLAATRSPRMVVDSARRELTWRRAETALDRAARRGEPVLVGPFLGEVGYELLYWIPLVRSLLRRRAIAPERVTALTRGGAGVWYADIAENSLEILDLIEPERFPELLRDRRARARDAKQLTVDRVDLELAAVAQRRIGKAHVLHPLLMYSRMRFIWEGLVPPERAPLLADYRLLDPPHATLPSGARLPSSYVAVKAYFSDSLPERAETRDRLASLVSEIAEKVDVVVLANRGRLDDHDEWNASGARVHSAASWLEPRSNLAVQTEIVAGAEALVCTYGGFSYLGPMLGVPTLALYSKRAFNPLHLEVLRAAFPEARLDLAHIDEATAGAVGIP